MARYEFNEEHNGIVMQTPIAKTAIVFSSLVEETDSSSSFLKLKN